jgi:adenylosuccinate lyase
LLSQDCIGEYSEPFHTGQKGSSSMPHKKNPITLENVSGLTTLIKSFWFTSVANIYSWNERDISHSSNERMYIETLFHLCCNIASKVEPLLKIDNFNIERIEQNLQAAKNIHSADLLTKFCLTEKSSRDELYKGIQESSNENK